MNREDIIRCAREAGFELKNRDELPLLERFAELVAADERELCAMQCDIVQNNLDESEGNEAGEQKEEKETKVAKAGIKKKIKRRRVKKVAKKEGGNGSAPSPAEEQKMLTKLEMMTLDWIQARVDMQAQVLENLGDNLEKGGNKLQEIVAA